MKLMTTTRSTATYSATTAITAKPSPASTVVTESGLTTTQALTVCRSAIHATMTIIRHVNGRYACVNITNYHTIEFRMFRGTLKYNTLIATLELVDKICELAIKLTDSELKSVSWSDFVGSLDDSTESELITYLKERQLYINTPITAEEDD